MSGHLRESSKATLLNTRAASVPEQRPPTFLANLSGTGLMQDKFSTNQGDDSRALHLLCTLFLLLPPQVIRHQILEVGDPYSI